MPASRRQPAFPRKAVACIVDVEPGRRLDVVVHVQRADRRPRLLRVQYELLDPVDEILASRSANVPAPKTSLTQRVRLQCPNAALREHDLWGTVLAIGESVQMRWRVKLLDRLGNVLSEDVLERQVYAEDSDSA